MNISIVTVGGGTGGYVLLTALKHLQIKLKKEGVLLKITAVVSVADDGGSTGRLRDEFGVLPPGDLRRALVALSHDTGALRKLFEYRFSQGEGLKGHSLGNLMLTALHDMYGDYGAIRHAGKILRVHGRIVPVTLAKTRLIAQLEDGQIIQGEHNIDLPQHDPNLRIEKIWLEPIASLSTQAKAAFRSADIIILGPGDLYTSIIPNVLTKGFVEEITRAKEEGASIGYVVNTMTKHGETTGFKAQDFVRVIEDHLGSNTLTHIICNTEKPPAQLAHEYEQEHAEFVEPNISSPRIIKASLMSKTMYARHDPYAFADIIEYIIKEKVK